MLSVTLENIDKEIKELMKAEMNWVNIDKLNRLYRLQGYMWAASDMGSLSDEEANEWVGGMVNEDGTSGAYWSIEQTNSLGESMGIDFTKITRKCWWVAVNMMRSDYYSVAVEYGVDTPEFYGALAKAFLFDKDAKSPASKMAAYFHGIVDRKKY